METKQETGKQIAIKEAIELQTSELKAYKLILRKNAYFNLQEWATMNNHLAETFNDIKRGQDLSGYVQCMVRQIRNHL